MNITILSRKILDKETLKLVIKCTTVRLLNAIISVGRCNDYYLLHTNCIYFFILKSSYYIYYITHLLCKKDQLLQKTESIDR